MRVLIEHQGRLRRLCKFVFTSRDASIYLVPYAPSGRYLFGGLEFPERETTARFDTTGQLSSDAPSLPHLSLHERGQVHTHAGAEKAAPLVVPPLTDWRGLHAATITANRFSGLALFDGARRVNGARPDSSSRQREGWIAGGSLYTSTARSRRLATTAI
jgi:hypothetical protein